MRPHGPRQWLGVMAGLAAVLVLLALPAPHRPAGPGAAASRTGPATLGALWPAARPFPLRVGVPGGSYAPVLVVDPAIVAGVATSADGSAASLVVSGAGGPRVLQTHSLTDGGSYGGVTLAGDRLYWIHSVGHAGRPPEVSLWSAALSGGPASMLTADVGQPLLYGSRYDLVPAGSRIYWMSADADQPSSTQLRSVALTGGPVSTQAIAGSWQLSAWPWLVTAPGAAHAPPRYLNIVTGAVTPVTVPANKLVTCDRAWCRLIPDDRVHGGGTDLVRPDGSDRQHVAGREASPVSDDPILLDRFEVLLTPVTHTLTGTPVSRLSLYDATRRIQVQVDPAATKAGALGDFVWWAAGDGEALTWHALDLRTLR